MKVIFDRSAFHDHFDLLKGSPLLRLANEGKVLVYHTALADVLAKYRQPMARTIAKGFFYVDVTVLRSAGIAAIWYAIER
jgi:hypothetical protein